MITVQLVGGLGNQLFGYFAARYFARNLGIKSACETSKIRGPLNAHRVHIDSLNLPGDFVNHRQSLGAVRFTAAEFIFAISARSTLFSRIVPESLRSYTSKSIGYDSEFTPRGDSIFVRGYFQSWKYSEHLTRDEILKIDVRCPSPWYKQTLAEIREASPIVMHVRRGDYTNNGDLWGLLGPAYYGPALALMFSSLGSRPVWIFSDDIAGAKQMLSEIVPPDSVFVDPPTDSNAAESLLLMTHAVGIVIANSTFSWWAARLRRNNGPVVAPGKWFRSLEDPTELIPADWKRIPSHWIDSDK